jgi:hypothetical protein
MTRKYPILDIKILYLKSAGYCSMSDCRLHLAQDVGTREKTKQIGNIAHIRAHSSGGPRTDPEYPQYKIDTYDNWILLCPTCHSTVDTCPNNYSVEDLLKIKVAHESWVSGCLNQGMTEFSFAELEVAAKAISTAQHFISNGDFHVISLEDKIQKNALTQESSKLICMGLSSSSEVSNFLVKMAQLDFNFLERLKNGFKQKYLELRNTASGDLLFIKMLEFAQKGASSFNLKCASLAILVHLFHLCDVFEK